MPELPEVHTVVQSLSRKIKNLKIIKYHELWYKVNYSKNSTLLKNQIPHTIAQNVARQGKYIIIKLKHDYTIEKTRLAKDAKT